MSSAVRYLCWRCGRVEATPGICDDGAERDLLLDEGDVVIGALVAERYYPLARAGQGGSARVYRARQRGTGRLVALKILEGVPDAEDRARSSREAEAMAQLRSSAIVGVYDAGVTSDGRPYLALEWLSGVTMEAWIEAHGPLQLPELHTLLEPVIAALAEIHQAGWVHRDLKARNLMVVHDPERRLRLLDFGLVKPLRAQGPAVTLADRLYGTPMAMAPEQWSEAYGPVSPATDVYAFGVLLYQLITGAWPFPGPGVAEQMQAHLHSAPPALPGPWGELIRRCLEKRPDRRPVDGRALLSLWSGMAEVPLPDLEARAAAETLGARPPVAPPRDVAPVVAALGPPGRPTRARAARWSVGALAGVGLLCAGIAAYEPRPPRPAAPTTEASGGLASADVGVSSRDAGDLQALAPAAGPREEALRPSTWRVKVLGPTELSPVAKGLRSALSRCDALERPHRVHLVLSGQGTFDALEVRPNDEAGRRLLECARPMLEAAPWPAFDGAFATVTFEGG